MADITVGQVAGIIAALIVVVQLVAPLVITLLVAGYLKDSESASTWSVAARKLQSSLWPTLLRLDTSRQVGFARGAIRILAGAMPIVVLLTAIASVVTPLGLGEELESMSRTRGSFEYAQDPSPFSAGTSPRGVFGFSRLCYQGVGPLTGPAACPYTGDEVDFSLEDGELDVSWDSLSSDIPDIIHEIFTSGTASEPSTISNFFDIEWRQYSSTMDDKINDGESYGIGLYRQLDSFILDNEYVIVEGLIIDAKIGGVGFRNHTLPTGLDRGATWTEDILFIEPEAVCVSTNLTLDFAVRHNSSDYSAGVSDLRLVDQGGFVNLNTTYPEFRKENPQADPDLFGRAYVGAFLNNAYTMLIYNITNDKTAGDGAEAFSYINSKIGSDFPLAALTGDGYQALGITHDFANYLHFSSRNSASFEEIPDYPNPFNVTSADLTGIALSCSGAGRGDVANASNIYVGCGLLRGAPRRTDGGAPSLLEHGSQWTSPLHSCATAVQAIIKTVTFSYNSTDNMGLEGLTITNIEPKTYSDEEDMPLWGFEESGLNSDGISATWGLISSEYESSDNMTALRQPSLYLPGYAGQFAPTLNPETAIFNNYPASEFPSRVMNSVFELSEKNWPFDLLGSASIAIFTRWQGLSTDPTQAAEIIRLLWTDLAASAVVGTKGILGPLNSAESAKLAPVDIRPVGRSITYNIFYGIPAFILALSLILLVAAFLFSLFFGKISFKKLRLRLQQLSPGRIFTSFLYSDASNLVMPSNEWAQANGVKKITLGAYADRSMNPMHTMGGERK